MSDISTILQNILSAIYGKDVRQAIHDGIELCYTDATQTDTTLTQSGRSADSKTVGDRFDDLESQIPVVDQVPTENSTNAVQSGGVFGVAKKLDDFVKAGLSIVKVNLKSLMTDHDKVYLYTGTETGESTGYWYYYNGTQFVPGGLYGAGVQIDSTLSQSGQAADAKVVGDNISTVLAQIPIIDAVPTQGSTNAVSSGGVYESINEISGDINDLKEDLNERVNKFKSSNIFDKSKVKPGKLDGNWGGISERLDYDYSDYIKSDANVIYFSQCPFEVVFYNNGIMVGKYTTLSEDENGWYKTPNFSVPHDGFAFDFQNYRTGIRYIDIDTLMVGTSNLGTNYIAFTNYPTLYGERAALYSDITETLIVDSASGAIASFTDGANYDAKKVICYINPLQTGTGTPAPDNIRPVSGYNELSVKYSGEDTSDYNTFRVSWQTEAGMVYGGSLTINDDMTAVLTKTWTSVDMGTLTWTYSYGMFSAYIEDIKRNPYTSDALYCSIYPTTPLPLSQFTYGIRYNGDGLGVYVKDPGYSDATTYKSAMSGQQIVYEIGAPITYKLTVSDAIKLLKGTNNVWHDANGNIDVTYNADTKLYFEKKSEEEAATAVEHHKSTTVTSSLTVGLPVLRLYGDTAAMTKETAVNLNYEYDSMAGVCSVKWQGASSLDYSKKNYTIKFDNNINVGWGDQKKYCFKANYIDNTSALNICGARLWSQIVATETGNPAIGSPNNGAMDGFPVIITLNGEFHGLYTWNIPKDKWAFAMGSSNTEYVVTAEKHSLPTQFRQLAELDGNDFELEYAADDVELSTVKTSLNAMLNVVKDLNASGWENSVTNLLDLNNVIDYIIFSALLANTDGTDKNFILTTYDGTKWYFNAYDLDSILGNYWTGGEYYSIKTTSFASLANSSHLFDLVCKYNKGALIERYNVLRNGILSDENLYMTFYNFCARIPKEIVDMDNKKWYLKPGTYTETLSRIMEWYRMRLVYIDAEIQELSGS